MGAHRDHCHPQPHLHAEVKLPSSSFTPQRLIQPQSKVRMRLDPNEADGCVSEGLLHTHPAPFLMLWSRSPARTNFPPAPELLPGAGNHPIGHSPQVPSAATSQLRTEGSTGSQHHVAPGPWAHGAVCGVWCVARGAGSVRVGVLLAQHNPAKQITSRAGLERPKLQVSGPGPAGPTFQRPQITERGRALPSATGRARARRRLKRQRNGRCVLASAASGPGQPRDSAAGTGSRDGGQWGPWMRRDGDPRHGGMGTLDEVGWGPWAWRNRDCEHRGIGTLSKQEWGLWAWENSDPGRGERGTLARVGWVLWTWRNRHPGQGGSAQHRHHRTHRGGISPIPIWAAGAHPGAAGAAPAASPRPPLSFPPSLRDSSSGGFKPLGSCAEPPPDGRARYFWEPRFPLAPVPSGRPVPAAMGTGSAVPAVPGRCCFGGDPAPSPRTHRGE